MAITVTIPDGFQYVGVAILSTLYLLAYQYVVVAKHRKASGIQYPQLYAEKAQTETSKEALIFNCAQRAHQNTLEHLPLIYVTTLLTGLRYPIPAACACGVWIVSRVAYTRGYVTGVPKRRGGFVSALGNVAILGQLLVSTSVAVVWLWGGVSKHL